MCSSDLLIDFQIRQLYLNARPRRFPAGEALQAASAPIGEGFLVSGAPLGPQLGRTVLAQRKPLDKMRWTLWVFTDVDPVRKQAVSASLLTAVVAGFLVLVWVAIAQRQRIVRQKLATRRMLERANAELESKVARRTSALAQTNERLRQIGRAHV